MVTTAQTPQAPQTPQSSNQTKVQILSPTTHNNVDVEFSGEITTFGGYAFTQTTQAFSEAHGVGWVVQEPRDGLVIVSLPPDYDRADVTCYIELMNKGAEGAVDDLVRVIDTMNTYLAGNLQGTEALERIATVLGIV